MPYLRESGESSPDEYDLNSIAVVGLSVRFPGEASTADKFWELLRKGRSTQTKVPESRYNADAFHNPSRGRMNTSITEGGHFIAQDVAAWDAAFFNIPQQEALAIDPQQRMMMEVTYEAFENAGLPVEKIAGTDTGVFVGSFTNDYREMLFRDAEAAPRYTATGAGSELLSNRLSWFYDLRGPSMTIGTACSSSLVAVHQACQSIRSGESKMAIAGGVNLLLNPDMFVFLSNQSFLALDGQCKSFDEKGDGYSRGEGIAAIILKPISDAIRDGDTIRAVIRGSGVNQDGKTKGITVPSAEAQAELIRSTYASAGLNYRDTHYFEAHGTGTKAGDPLEARAISQTLSTARERGDNLLVGSVKANIGHLEACAGLAGLIKSIYILETGIIPANILYKAGNPTIPFQEWRIKVPTKTTAWPKTGLRRISVNSFGYGGTNAHAILDDAFHYLESRGIKANHNTIPKPSLSPLSLLRINKPITEHYPPGDPKIKVDRSKAPNHSRIFSFSAHDSEGLTRMRSTFSAYLHELTPALKLNKFDEDAYLRDLAFTLSNRRTHLPWKLTLTSSSIEELKVSLNDKHSGTTFRSTKQPRLGFVFTGQGAQWAQMGMELSHFDVFRESVEEADRYLKYSLGCKWTVMEEIRRDEKTSNINLPQYSQALCTVLQVAIVDLLESWDITPTAVVGHSSGEIAAAYCLGALSREDAWKLAHFRGTLSSQMKTLAPDTNGTMMAAGLSEDEAWDWISKVTLGEVVVACVNSPSSVTISGDVTGIDELEAILKKENVFARKLKVETAYHSPHMSIIAAQYLQEISDIEPMEPTTARKMYSSVTGELAHYSELGPANWVRNLLSPVLFSNSLHDLLRPMQPSGERASESAVDMLVELGPHAGLQGPVNQVMKNYNITGVDYCSILMRKKDALQTALACVGQLIVHGVSANISKANNSVGEARTQVERSLVDLPPYSWNHTRTYWGESRVAKQYRSREHPQRSLIGAPAPAFNDSERSWRGFIRMAEDAWISDHKIQSSVLYPAAGYIAMAIEGACQMADVTRVVKYFTLRDIQITSALVLTEDTDVETIVQIRPHLIGTKDSAGSTWLDFNISSCADGVDLRQNCSGMLLIEYQSPEGSDMLWEVEQEDKASRRLLRQAEIECLTSEDPADFYKDLTSLGLVYGPTFRNMTRIRKDTGKACCQVTISDTGTTTPLSKLSGRPHIIHPATLDAMFHAAFAAVKGNKGQLDTAMVPKSIEEVKISADILFEPGAEFNGFSAAAKHGFKELMADIQMLQGDSESPAVKIKGFCCSEISGMSKQSDDGDDDNKKLCTQIVWKPTLELLSGEKACELVNAALPDTMTVASMMLIEKSEMLALDFIRTALNQVSIDQVSTPQLQQLYMWMQEQESALLKSHTHRLRADNSDWLSQEEKEPTKVLQEIKSNGSEGEALSQVGPALGDILQGSVTATELLASSLVMTEMTGMSECRNKLTEFIALAAHNNPTLSILELGNGSIRTAESILSLQNSDLFKYTLTNASLEVLENVKAQFQTQPSSIEYKVLDIEQNTGKQAYEDHTYDIIIAANSLYTVQSVDKALANAHNLLKPSGKICVIEVTHPGLRLGVILGSLPGYSRLSEGHHKLVRSAKEWAPVLEQSGFTTDIITTDFEDLRYQQLSLIVATACENAQANEKAKEIIILESATSSPASQDLAAKVALELEASSVTVTKTTWNGDVSSLTGKKVIALLEIETSFLEDMSEHDFTPMQQLVLQTSSLLWVTSQSTPANALAVGLARVVQNETASLELRTLQVSLASLSSPAKLAPLVAKLCTASVDDTEFVEEDGVIKVSRLVDDALLNEKVSIDAGKIDHIQLSQASGPQKLSIQSPGMLDSLCFESDEDAFTELADDEVEIQVKATGLNFRDVMVCMGQIPDKLLGFEASGIITRIGKNVEKFEIGDSICTLGHGAHRAFFRNKAIFCQPMPEGISFEEAATLPLVHCTAFHALVRIARVSAGQSILVHAAAGGVGQAAIQIAKHFGMEIFATVGSADKRSLIQDVYGVEADHIFNSRDVSFQKGIMRMTKGRGVDVVLNSLSGEALRQSFYCIAPFGTFVEIGIKDILGNTGLDMRPFLQDATFVFLNLNHVTTKAPKVMAEIMEGAFDLLRRGITKAVFPLTIYPVSEVENAFRLMQTGKHRGKIAISFGETDVVPVLHKNSSVLKLDENSTYVLVGGLGGLGRSLSNLLVENGARNLCFVSRSGANSEKARKQIQDLEDQGIHTKAYCCDVANADSLKETLARCSNELPPIRGVIQCAMVLRDNLFENLSYQEWIDSTRPKVQGTWNLHSYLPETMDFFVILSSFAGVFGNRGQANYAAAGAYQDAFAKFRRSKGLKSVTIDLGIMRDVGVIAEQGATGILGDWEEPFGLREFEFHALLKEVLSDQVSGKGEMPDQIVTGLATGGTANAAGIQPPFYFDDARFSVLKNTGLQNLGGLAADGTVPIKTLMAQAQTVEEAAKVIVAAVTAKVAKSLQTEESEIDAGRPLHSYGVDSLVAVEIRNWVFKELKAEITVFDILSAVPITALSQAIALKSKLLPEVLAA